MYNKIYNFSLKEFINVRLHIGHKSNNLNKNINSYIYGFRHNISIFDIEKIWKSFRLFFHSLKYITYYRNTFFLVGTNTKLPMNEIINHLLKQYPFKINNFSSFYINGYADKKWIGGLFSNWRVTLDFINHIKKGSLSKQSKKRYQKYIQNLEGIIKTQIKTNPIPDYILMLDSNNLALKEAFDLDYPIFGLIDSNIDSSFFLYKFYGNDDAIESINFFFELLKDAIKEGRLKEQERFFLVVLQNLKKYKKFVNKAKW